MKKLILIGLFSLGSAMAAQAGGLAGYGAYWSPDELDADFGGGAKVQFDLADELALDLRGTYFPDLNEESGGNSDFEVTAAEAGLAVIIPLDDDDDEAARAYIGGGGGYYFLEVDNNDAPNADVDDEVGWYAVGGLELDLSEEVALFAEAMWRGIEATVEDDELDDPDEIEEHVDIDLDGIGANAGLVLLW